MIYINIGSNINSKKGNRIYNLNKSINLINSQEIKIIKVSGIYETPSYPNEKNPKFLNVCLAIKSKKRPDELIKLFKIIEKKLQRKRGQRNQPRTCDIDIIDYEKKIIKTKSLIAPHPRAHLRNFVLFPLQEVCPSWSHPILNKKIQLLIKKLNFKLRNEITRLKESVIIDK